MSSSSSLHFHQAAARAGAASRSIGRSLATVADDVAQGLFEISHNSFALLGLALVFGVVMLTARGDLRSAGEARLMGWLQARHEAAAGPLPEPDYVEPDAIDRATASNPTDLPKQQAAVAFWLSKKYSVAPEPLSALVAEAFEIGRKARLDPTLILAIMAIESGFNPFAQSKVGAQGLMQVMTKVHTEKYDDFGGRFAAFDPVTNLRVGVKVLQECITRAGSIEGGLKLYVGAGNLADDGGYASKVLAEHSRLQGVVGGKPISPFSTPSARAVPVKATPAGPLERGRPEASQESRGSDARASEGVDALGNS
jgi:Transglycosylase SLT domain